MSKSVGNYSGTRAIVILSLIGCLALLLIGTSSFRGGKEGIFNFRSKSVVSYLDKVKEQENKILSIYKAIGDQTNGLNIQSEDSRETFVDNMKILKEDIEGTIRNLENIEPPKGLGEFRTITIGMCKSLLNSVNSYISGAYESNQSHINEGRDILERFKIEGEYRKTELIKAFERFKIRYKVEGDGSLRYWYRTISESIKTF
jgi:hypothetical protein